MAMQLTAQTTKCSAFSYGDIFCEHDRFFGQKNAYGVFKLMRQVKP